MPVIKETLQLPVTNTAPNQPATTLLEPLVRSGYSEGLEKSIAFMKLMQNSIQVPLDILLLLLVMFLVKTYFGIAIRQILTRFWNKCCFCKKVFRIIF
jgi:fumarate reductase subunit C